MLPDQPGGAIPGSMVAGVDTEHIQILTDLMSKGVTIEHLRKLNAMNTIQLKTLLDNAMNQVKTKVGYNGRVGNYFRRGWCYCGL
jgi:hypothetical protein